MDNSVLQEVTEKQVDNNLTIGINKNNTPLLNAETKSIKDKSEETYLRIVQEVVRDSKWNLATMHEEKLDLRCRLIEFCLHALSVQMIFLIVLLLAHKALELSDGVLSVYMTAVFVETLGAVIVMVKYAFKSDEEVKIIDILNAVVKNFQKYTDTEKEEKNK